ncbi:MAG TPA: aldo/keto reductase [Novosphingobium sp.]
MTSLDEYRHLGRSGLRVSPLVLGTMNFGAEWGVDETGSREIFDTYVDRGGNFVDTAGYYSAGLSEAMLGKFMQGRRDSIVLSTKYSLNAPADVNAAGNSRKSMVMSVEQSLRRMQTDYIDLLFLHSWNDTAPEDEILRAFDDLVRQGKVLYIGLSNTPAWRVARLQTIAELRGWARFVSLQIEYSLLERTVERELIPAAEALGMGVLPWSPLSSGRLSGGYATGAVATGRRSAMLAGAYGASPEVTRVADAVKEVADELGVSSSQVALAWLRTNPNVTGPVIGPRTAEQLVDSIAALDVQLDGSQLARLEEASKVEPVYPDRLLDLDFIQAGLSGGHRVLPRV